MSSFGPLPVYQAPPTYNAWPGIPTVNMTLVFAGLQARHGVRSPYPPYGESLCNTYTKYSGKDFPTISDWNMTTEEFCEQQLTPHGKKSATRVGEYYRDVLERSDATRDGHFDFSCDTLAIFADNSTRDIQTATQFLTGFGCIEATPIAIAGATNLTTSVWPTVNDNQNQLECPTATEDQIMGQIGDHPAFLTASFARSIELVSSKLLGMEDYANATICAEANPAYNQDIDGPCTMFQTGFGYTGLYFQGNFQAPYNRAGFFAELFMLQYTSGLEDWAFGEITIVELEYIFALHVQNMVFGANQWRSQAYGSQGVGYMLASLQQGLTKTAIPGVEQDTSKNILLLQGHDFNLFYMFEILKLKSILEQAEAARSVLFSTTGMLRFDLLQDDNNPTQYYVQISYVVPTPQQQRSSEALFFKENPPAIVVLTTPFCNSQVYCPYETFKALVLEHISLDCIQDPLRTSLMQMQVDPMPVPVPVPVPIPVPVPVPVPCKEPKKKSKKKSKNATSKSTPKE